MDLILINGKIHTMDKLKPTAEAVVIKAETIVMVGSSEDAIKLKTDCTEIIDLQGKVLLPGFNDSHMHLLNFGLSLRMVDLNGVKAIDEIIERTKSFIEAKGIEKGRWIQGRGWNQDYFQGEKRFPTRYDLDMISAEHPIALSRACGHVCIVNSKALELMGITKDTPQVDGGYFDLDQEGEPLGIFRENALSLIYEKISSPKVPEVKAIIKEAAAYANSKGLTSVQSDDLESIPGGSSELVLQAYNELKEEGLTLRVNEQCLLPDMNKLKKFLHKGYRTGYGNELFKIGPLKLLADGSLGARTAALCEPYADDKSTSGILVYDQKELEELVKLAHDSHMQVAVHGIGDKTMYMALEALEKALKDNPQEDHRHSIVHCQITDEVLLDKFRDMKVTAHIQPIFLHYDIHIVESRIGKEKAKRAYAFKTMNDKGIHIGMGTDCPVEPLDVMPCIYCAVTRKDLKGYPEKGWLPEERLSLEEAVYNYTMGSAYASFEDNIKGSITEGKLADLVVLSEDIFEVKPERIKDIKVEMTFLGGKLVYHRTQYCE
jgi:predicted amidohydrolase YtcJ